jgi:hypothetical protein
MLQKIISGGQTGVDRAALDAALAAGVACGGWCPLGRWAEDGPIDPRYPLSETASADPAERTRANVAAADATLILSPAPLFQVADGTRATADAARASGKPWRVEMLPGDPAAVRDWIAVEGVAALNVAGPRESTCPGVYQQACAFMAKLLGWPT